MHRLLWSCWGAVEVKEGSGGCGGQWRCWSCCKGAEVIMEVLGCRRGAGAVMKVLGCWW